MTIAQLALVGVVAVMVFAAIGILSAAMLSSEISRREERWQGEVQNDS